MSLVIKETTNGQGKKIKVTSHLYMPGLEVDPAARIELRLKALIANSDWIYDSLNLFDKALNNITTLDTFDQWALERLDLTARTENGTLILMDRYFTELSRETLENLKSKIIAITASYASKLVKSPDLHHMEKTFIRALRKSAKNKLTEEETNVLKEAYLKLENGKVVNLKGTAVSLPRFNFLRLLIA